jgi:hypothetical protein
MSGGVTPRLRPIEFFTFRAANRADQIYPNRYRVMVIGVVGRVG